MLWNIISWLVVGGLAGWIASIIMKTNAQQGALANIIIGILGAFIGGFIVQLLSNGDGVDTFSIPGFIVAVLGAVILLWIVKAVRGGRATV